MPIQSCSRNGKTGKRWGQHGRCYLGKGASAKAGKQAAAARANGYEGHAECHCGGKCAKCKKAVHFREGYRLPRTQIFAAGVHRGKRYSERDLEDMVRNFDRSSAGRKPLLRVPAVLGHEEDQEYLERSDLPAAGWASRVYRDGRTLYADFEDVSPKVARLLKGKAYRTVSAEIYDEPPEGVPGTGKMLRRVAFLGGEIPQVKSIDDIPTPEAHAEVNSPYRATVLRFRETFTKPGSGFTTCFSEVVPMDKEELLKTLGELGFDTAAFEGLPDDKLMAIGNEILRVYSAEEDAEGEHAEGEEPTETTDHDETPPATPKSGDAPMSSATPPPSGSATELSEDEVNKLPAEKQAEYYKARYAEMKKMTDDAAGAGDATPKKITTTQHFSEQKITAIVNRAVEKALKEGVEGSIQRLTKFQEQTEASRKKERIESFCEEQLASGRITAAEMDRSSGRPNIVDRLMLLDASKPAVKFKEKGKTVEMSQLDLELDAIKNRPAVFGERVKTVKGGKAESDDSRIAKVEKFCETFKASIDAAGQTKEQYVESFKKASKTEQDALLKEFDEQLKNAA